MSLVLEVLSAFFLTSVQVYLWCKLSASKIKRLSFRLTIVLVLLTCFSLIKFEDNNEFVGPLMLVLSSVLSCKFLLREKIRNCIIIVFCQYLLIITLEGVFGIIALIILNSNLDTVLNNTVISTIADIILGFITIFVVNTKLVKRFYSFISRHAYNLKNYRILLLLLLVIICSTIIFALTYFSNNIFLSIIINIIITIIYAVIILVIINTKNNYITVIERYNTSLDNIQAQESIINEYRIINHENKNNLTTIKSMSNDKKVVTYINSLLKQNKKLKSKLLTETLKLPEGGIRGLIYNKLLIMQDNDIAYHLNVDKIINPKILFEIDDYDIVDICQILGVFLDNAIDETKLLTKKSISIDFYLNNNKLVISIANNCINDLSKNINFKTTKGNGHGYGLKLVKKILERNHHLKNEREILKNIFVQKLIIKLNKADVKK